MPTHSALLLARAPEERVLLGHVFLGGLLEGRRINPRQMRLRVDPGGIFQQADYYWRDGATA